jgi:hypothetical protein
MNPNEQTEKRILSIIQEVTEHTSINNQDIDTEAEVSAEKMRQYVDEVIEEVQRYGLLKGV